MKHFIVLIALTLTTAFALSGQSTRISGRVLTSKKEPLAGASVSIKGGYDGATADSSGSFVFETADTGRSVMAVTAMGFKDIEQEVTLSGSALSFEFLMKEMPNELQAVIITAGSFEASDEKKVTVLKPLDIVTTASANADVAAAMRTLPGTQQIGESAELFVRGGEGYETRQYIDGTTVPNPFFAQAPGIASRGRFSPFLFKGTVFSTGGYSALYGQALSSALILESIDLPDQSSASASLSPLFVGGQYQSLARDKKSSWGASAGYTDLQPYYKLIKQRPDFFEPPTVYNADANFRIKTSGSGMLKFYANYASTNMGLRRPDVDDATLKNAFSIGNDNLYTNLSYRERIKSRLKMNLGMSFSRNTDDVTQTLQNGSNQNVVITTPGYMAAKAFGIDAVSTMWQARASFDYKLKGLSSIKWGSEYWYSENEATFNQLQSTLKDHFGAAFAEADVYITNNLAGRAGLRTEYSSLMEKANVMPRASLAYKLNGGAQFSFDYGLFYQKPTDDFLRQDNNLGYMRADHYILTYQKIVTNRVFRAQLFHKDYSQLVRTYPTLGNEGSGYARGLEFFWRDKKTFKNFDYWVTYSWLDTKRAYLNFPYTLQPNFAANHTANLVVKRFFQKLNTQFNVNYQFATGRPYYDIAYDNATQKFAVRSQGETIPYNNLSLSLNYLPKLGKTFTVVVLSINNVLNSKQVFGYNFSYDGNRKIAVQPPANQFFFFGVFLSWGVDRTQDAINNNL